MNEFAAREIGDANIAGRNMTFSPDGRWLAFTEGDVLKKIAVDGGQAVNIGRAGGSVPYGLSWGPTDTIYVGSFAGLWKVPASGGEPLLVAAATPVPRGSADAGRTCSPMAKRSYSPAAIARRPLRD